jgi:hypothetical protein
MVPYRQTRVYRSEVLPSYQLFQNDTRTVVIPTTNVRPWSIATDLASARPIDRSPHTVTSSSTSCRRRMRSPRGEMNKDPIAYPAWARVGISATSSLEAPKSLAILHLIRSHVSLQHRNIRYEHRLNISLKQDSGNLLDNSKGLR